MIESGRPMVPLQPKRWTALTHYLDDGQLPIGNNHIEQRIRQIAIDPDNWLFAESLHAGKRAAAIMTLVQSARMNDHDPYGYLKDVLTRLPTQPASRIGLLLPHNWTPQSTTKRQRPLTWPCQYVCVPGLLLIGDWIRLYNHRRPHQTLNMKKPAAAFALAA